MGDVAGDGTASQTENTILNQILQSLKAEVSALREAHDEDRREIEALKAKLEALESQQLQDTDRICLDVAMDRQRISALEHKGRPQPMQRDRSKILRALLAANGGKMLMREARKTMRISKPRKVPGSAEPSRPERSLGRCWLSVALAMPSIWWLCVYCSEVE